MKSQQEHLLSKYVGTGDADTARHDWAVNQHRDTYAYLASSADSLAYLAVATDTSAETVRVEMLSRMPQPCGPAPPPQDHNMFLAGARGGGVGRWGGARLHVANASPRHQISCPRREGLMTNCPRRSDSGSQCSPRSFGRFGHECVQLLARHELRARQLAQVQHRQHVLERVAVHATLAAHKLVRGSQKLTAHAGVSRLSGARHE